MPRNEGESSAEYLARTLEAAGLHDMARRARLFYFDDYFCPPEIDDGNNIGRLVRELRTQANAQVHPKNRQMVLAIANQAIEGEFDGTPEESDRWAETEEAQDVFRHLIGRALRAEEEANAGETNARPESTPS